MSEFLLKLLDPLNPKTKEVDPSLAQGARFNIMQSEITKPVFANLPLMNETTGNGLKSIKESMVSSLDKLDTKETSELVAGENKYNGLLQELQQKQKLLDSTISNMKQSQGSKRDPRNDYEYKCMQNGKQLTTYAFYDYDTLTPTQVNFIKEKYKGEYTFPQDKGVAACVNGCPGTCDQMGEGILKNVKAKINNHAAEIKQLETDINNLNSQIMVQANNVAKATYSRNNANNKVHTGMNVESQNIQQKLNILKTKKDRLNALLQQQSDLDGQIQDRQNELDSSYMNYMVWFLCATTLGIIAVKKLSE